MKATFEGRIAHHFHMPYWCTMALVFNSESDAKQALTILGSNWKIGKQPKAVVASLKSDELDAMKKCFESHGMDAENIRKIDSIAKSIDYGEPFEGSLNVDNLDQACLF